MFRSRYVLRNSIITKKQKYIIPDNGVYNSNVNISCNYYCYEKHLYDCFLLYKRKFEYIPMKYTFRAAMPKSILSVVVLFEILFAHSFLLFISKIFVFVFRYCEKVSMTCWGIENFIILSSIMERLSVLSKV
uniref:Uncharacterized protein n=1 Tax=Glossina brevipalpis TaxID=37001 RepID=A0A1A9WXC2_9MUSC